MARGIFNFDPLNNPPKVKSNTKCWPVVDDGFNATEMVTLVILFFLHFFF